MKRICLARILMAMMFSFLGWCGYVYSNNIRIIGKPVLENQDTVKNTILIRFDIAWDNSWKTTKPDNHDAAWIFVKCWDGEAWNHVYLEKDGAVAGSTSAADAVNKGTTYYVSDREGKVTNQKMELSPGYSYAWKQWHVDPDEDSVQCIVGYFLRRSTYGAGHVVVPGVTFKWNYGNQGFVDGDDLVVKVFAIEMVYVPEGPYYLGGKGEASWQVGSFTTNGNTFGVPMVVESEKTIKVENSASPQTLFAANNAITAGEIPEDFPKGYQAFYIMKYEMTQEAYCEFLNTLNQGQQDGRIQGVLANLKVNDWAWGGDLSPYRNYIKIKQAAPVAIFGCDGNMNNVYNQVDVVNYGGRSMQRNIDGQDLAVNFVSMYDLLAYAQFAGLRPMTELEYEKACRGPREPVNDEYAWGSVTKVFYGAAFNTSPGTYTQTNTAIIDALKGTERVGDQYNVGYTKGWNWSNVWWGSVFYYYPAPLRVGIFADSTSTRASSGATYWGVMNMSDNVGEMCISVVDGTGRKFKGVHGCGQLDGNGDAFMSGWNISSLAKYFIVRGMQFPYFYVTAGRGATNHEALGNVITRGDKGKGNNYYSGMISSRHRWNHAIVGTERTATLSGNCMVGIRCVRTEDAEM